MVYQQMLHVMAYNCIKRPCVSNDIHQSTFFTANFLMCVIQKWVC